MTAANAHPRQQVGSVQAAQEDRQLVERCVAGEQSAWDRLYQIHHPILLALIKSLLGARSSDENLVEEIAARVWYTLVRDGAKRLARYDGRRGYRLSTFLAAFAKRELLQHFRSEQRRRAREQSASLPSNSCSTPPARPAGFLVEEFLTQLTPREREFFEANLVRNESQHTQFSTANAWQLKHRVHRKLRQYLRGQ